MLKVKYNCIFIIIIVVLNTIMCNASIVSDNDGTAFITKAEFESMKADFDEQINNYNKSIDNKIDGAIAQYLASIKLNKKTQLDIVYPYDAEWTSNTAYSYDTVSNKYWKYEATFEQPNKNYWSKYKYLYNNDLYYYTFKKNDNNRYEWNKIQFRLWGTLWFFRGYNTWNTAGYVRWADDFWPSSIKLGKFESKYSTPSKPPSTNWRNGGQYGYSGVTYPTVYEESVDNYILAAVSTVNTYTYVPNNELIGNLGGKTSDNENFTREVDYLDATTVDSFGVYREMTVNTTYSNVPVITNNLVLEWLKSYSSNNNEIVYGVNIFSYDETGTINLKFDCNASGIVRIGAGFSASNAYANMSDYDVNAGSNEIEFDVEKSEGTDVFLIYLPTNSSAYGKISSMTAILTLE